MGRNATKKREQRRGTRWGDGKGCYGEEEEDEEEADERNKFEFQVRVQCRVPVQCCGESITMEDSSGGIHFTAVNTPEQ